MRNSITALFVLLAGCGGSDFATVVVALGSVPPSVATLGVTVRDVESREEITSATVDATAVMPSITMIGEPHA